MEEREEELIEKQQDIAEIEEKFTSILLSLAQEVAGNRRVLLEGETITPGLSWDSDTPSFLKALQLDRI